MELCNFFEFSVERNPDKVAVVEKNKRLTYFELNEEVNKIASSLQKLGLRKQDRVMVLLKNSLENVVLYWAVQKLGAIFTPINFLLSKDNIRFCIQDVEPKFIVFEDLTEHLIIKENFEERPIFIGITNNNQLSDISYEEMLERGENSFDPVYIVEQDISIIYYTSGTTGVPKGVPRTHENEYASTMAHILQCRYEPFDMTLGSFPLYHVIGLRSLQAMTALNGGYVVPEDYGSYESLHLIDKEKVSCLFLTPTMYHDLVYHPNSIDVNFSALHTIVYSGARMSEALLNKCDEIMHPTRIVNHYGSTEIYTFTYCDDVRKKPGSAGRPGIQQNIRLITPDPKNNPSSRNVVSQGEVGEIIVNMKSPEAFKGYWNRPDITGKLIYEGWYYTGDLGFVDQDGDLNVIGRTDDMIISGGENIYPEFIEKILLEHSKVSQAVIIGEEDERLGQVVVAYIVTSDESLTYQELDRFCKYHQELTNYKRPRKYVFINDIPKTPSGKLLRSQLRKDI